MPLPLLDERYRDGYPTRSPEDKHAWLNAEEERFILWGFKDHWSAARIGRALGVSATTVRRFRDKYWRTPALLLELGLFEMVSGAAKDEYRCLVCGDRIKERPKVQRHLRAHYVDEANVDAVPGVDDEVKRDELLNRFMNKLDDIDASG